MVSISSWRSNSLARSAISRCVSCWRLAIRPRLFLKQLAFLLDALEARLDLGVFLVPFLSAGFDACRELIQPQFSITQFVGGPTNGLVLLVETVAFFVIALIQLLPNLSQFLAGAQRFRSVAAAIRCRRHACRGASWWCCNSCSRASSSACCSLICCWMLRRLAAASSRSFFCVWSSDLAVAPLLFPGRALLLEQTELLSDDRGSIGQELARAEERVELVRVALYSGR